MTERAKTPFFGFYLGVPMTGQTPTETLLRAADAAVRDAMYNPNITRADADGLLQAAGLMRGHAEAGR